MGYGILVILSYGLPAIALAYFGRWILRRETSEVIRAVAYLLVGVGIFVAIGALVRSLIGLVEMFGF